MLPSTDPKSKQTQDDSQGPKDDLMPHKRSLGRLKCFRRLIHLQLNWAVKSNQLDFGQFRSLQ